MAAELMLINPRRRHRRRKARVIRAKRNPTRRRRRRLSALQAQYFGKRRRSGGRKRRARVIHARSNPIRRRRHRRRHFTVLRRNPISVGNPVGFVSAEIVPAAMGAVGGLATNWIFDNYAPTMFQSGILNPIGRLGLAAGLGFAVAKVTDNRTGQLVAAGAMTITVYEMLQNYMQGGGLFSGGGMGRIMNSRMGRVGYMNPARQMNGIARFVPHH